MSTSGFVSPSYIRSFIFSSILLLASSVFAESTPPDFGLAFYAGAGAQEGNGVATDTNGNIYVTGQYVGSATIGGTAMTSNGVQDYFIASYDSQGNPRWGKGAGSGGSDYGTSVKIAPNGDVVTSATIYTPVNIHGTNFSGAGGRDAVVARYTSDGALLWAKTVGGISTDSSDDVAVDANGNVILAGRIRGLVTIGSTTIGSADTNTLRQFVAKFDANGDAVWAVAATAKSESSIPAGAVAVDGNNDVCFAGQDYISGSAYVTVIKYSSTTGAEIWRTNHPTVSTFSSGTGISVDGANNIYVSGTYSSGPITFGTTTLDNPNGSFRGFLVKHDSSGSALWASRLGTRAYRVSVTTDGTAYTTGFFGNTTTNFDSLTLTNLSGLDGYVTKHSSDGQIAWAKPVSGYENEILRSITVNENGVAHVTGEGTTEAFEYESSKLGNVVVARLENAPIPKFTLTRSTSPAGSGFLAATPEGINNRYFSNTVVQVRAYAGSEKGFAGWSGDASGTNNPINIVMDSDKNIVATFTNLPFTGFELITVASPSQGGTIDINPPSETHKYDSNALVTLTAVPNSNYVFLHWGGSISTNVNPVTVTMDSTRYIVAYFSNSAPVTYTLTKNVNPAGFGTINANPASADGSYTNGTVVTLTASSAAGKRFTGWSGAATGTNNPIQITMNGTKSITANFTNAPVSASQFFLAKNVSPSASGYISVSPVSTNGYYASNTVVTLTATPASSNYKFVRWSGASSATTNRITLTMNMNKSVTAVFTNLPKYKLNTSVNPVGAGVIYPSPSSPSNMYPAGAFVTLTAASNSTNIFAAWAGDVSGLSNKVSLTMSTNKTATALFNNPGKFVFQNTNGQLAVWFMQSTQRITTAQLNNNLSAGAGLRLAGAADFDNNRSKDLVFQGSNGQVTLWKMSGNNKTNTLLLRNGFAQPLSWRLVAAADLNKDLKADLLWQNTNGVLQAWLMNGVLFSSAVTLTPSVPTGSKVVAVANFDTNSAPDYVLQNANRSVTLWLMNGLSRTGIVNVNGGIAPAAGFVLVGAGDISGDGKNDILFQGADGSLLAWFMNGTTFSRAVTLPAKATTGWTLRAVK